MKYAQAWIRQINDNTAKILIFFYISIFAFFLIFISAQLKAQKFIQQAQGYLGRAQDMASNNMLVEQAVFYKKAVRSFSNAVKSNPFDDNNYFIYADCLSNKIDESGNLDNLFDLGDMPANTLGLKDPAGFFYAQAIKRNPLNAIYHQRLASSYEKLSDYAKAEEEMLKAAMLDPQNVSIQLYLTQYYLSRGKQSEFNYHLGRVVEIFKVALKGGGPMGELREMVVEFLRSINREELIND